MQVNSFYKFVSVKKWTTLKSVLSTLQQLKIK